MWNGAFKNWKQKWSEAILLSKSALADLALRLALDQGITVVGFIPMEQLWGYSHPERIAECR
jgi:formate dehydrogenase assembly factor FdhD